MTEEETEVAGIIADAAPLPLLDAAYALRRRRYRLDSLEGRPTAEEIRINRTLTPEQFAAKYRHDRDACPLSGLLRTQTGHRLRSEKCQKRK